MYRYKVLATNVIEIDLVNGYKIIAIADYKKLDDCYYFNLMLRDSTINVWDLMEMFECVRLKCDRRELKNKLCEYVTKAHKNGYFNYYLCRYKRMMKCFDYGNEYIEHLDCKE